jgi:ABC-2 type transport system ATP-binding protein
MGTTYNPRLAEIKAYFNNGDTHLGYRRLLDAAIETQDGSVYADTLAFCDWYDAATARKEESTNALHEKVADLLQVIDSVPPKERTPSVLLSAHGISKKYHKGNFSLQPLDISLQSGEITGLVGENGNGKTTLLRLLYGELMPDAGSIEYHINNLPAHPSFYDTKSRLAFIPQRPNAWYGALMDNLQLAATHFGQTGKDNFLWTEMIVARMGLRPFRSYTWSRISSGYKMRFELARTLVKKPEILLLDEPLANLDVLAQQIILEDLRYIAQSKTMPMAVILSSQQLYEVEKVSTQVIFLQKGMAKMQQPPQQGSAPTEAPLVLELETTATREQLQELFGQSGLQKISFNGGIYILYFAGSSTIGHILQTIGQAGLPVKYLRDISTSSRRFFDA